MYIKILCILFYQTCIYYLVVVFYTHIFIIVIKWYPHLFFCLGSWGLIQDSRQKWRKSKFFPFEQDIYQTCIYYLVLVFYTHIFIILIKWYPHLFFCLGGWGLIQDSCQKWRKSKFFPFEQDTLVLPCGSKIRLKSLYLLRFSRYSYFFTFRKNPRWPPKVAKIEIFPLSTGNSCTTLWVKNSLEIALSLTVFEIFILFHFPQKSKMAAKSGENRTFSPLHRTLLYYPVGQRFA